MGFIVLYVVAFSLGLLLGWAWASPLPPQEPVYISTEVYLRNDLERALVKERSSRMILELENAQLKRAIVRPDVVPQKEELL